jgi:hypothetical protein
LVLLFDYLFDGRNSLNCGREERGLKFEKWEKKSRKVCRKEAQRSSIWGFGILLEKNIYGRYGGNWTRQL